MLEAFHREIVEFALCDFTAPIHEFRQETETLLVALKQNFKPNKKEHHQIISTQKARTKTLLKKSLFFFWAEPSSGQWSDEEWFRTKKILVEKF